MNDAQIKTDESNAWLITQLFDNWVSTLRNSMRLTYSMVTALRNLKKLNSEAADDEIERLLEVLLHGCKTINAQIEQIELKAYAHGFKHKQQ